jgi:hypothetical protein
VAVALALAAENTVYKYLVGLRSTLIPSLCVILFLSLFPTCMLCSVAHINHISTRKTEK